jgi:glutamate dehydrogenase/leucine dehydrogenase
MAWIMDTFSILKGYSVPGVVTGKPLELGGSLGRFEATGKGVFITAQEACRHLRIPIEGARVVVQGCGNVGGIAAQYFDRAGAKVIAISDSKGGVLIFQPFLSVRKDIHVSSRQRRKWGMRLRMRNS